MATAAQITDLATGWKLKRTDESNDAWLPVEKVPTVVHLDLLRNESRFLRIPDPFLGTNELIVEWVGEHSWTYETSFQGPTTSNNALVYLLFDGLDTFAKVQLNGTTILESDNMFISHRVDITNLLRPCEANILSIEFDSALLRGRMIEKEHPEHKFICFNGETSRLCVRKAQYHWGWDWGPVLMTAGPWRPVRLEVSHTHIDDVFVHYNVSDDLSTVIGKVRADVRGLADEIVIILSYGNEQIFHVSKAAEQGTNVSQFELFKPNLWYPAGYGKQSLYSLTVHALYQGTVLNTWEKKTGFRKSQLVREKDDQGESFYFRINNVDIFCGGSCWIPAHSLLPSLTADNYRSWLQIMIEGNQVMTRVWGGGIYEDDTFYDTCDELGILVWQDFMFACGVYPYWPSFSESIQTEAKVNIRRLRHHPSIVIWAGNNEDYQVQEQCQLEYDYNNKDPKKWLKTSFPGRYYYEHLLPSIMEDEAPGTQYWPGSPFSNGKPSSDLDVGDVHQWNVWHGTQEKYQRYGEIGGRFNSEFGLAAFPVLKTVKEFVFDHEDLYPQSHVVDFHNKADGHERRIATYVMENFRISSDLASWVYLTQLAQSEAMTYAYRSWRRQWGEARHCGGALVWQLNDCWPATSWSIVDHFLRKKPAFYAIKRSLSPIAVGVQREHHDWSVCHARPKKSSSYKLWISSSLQHETHVDVELRFLSIDTGEQVKPTIKKANVTVAQNGVTNILSGVIDNTTEKIHVLAARVFQSGVCIARDVDWPQPFKYLSFANRGIKVAAKPGKFVVSAEKPTKGFVVEELDGCSLSDNCLDIMPGDSQIINYTERKDPQKPRFTYLESSGIIVESHIELAEAYDKAHKVLELLFPLASLEELSSMTRGQLLALLQSSTASLPATKAREQDHLHVLEPSQEQNFTWDEVSDTGSDTSRVADDVNGLAFSRQSLSASYLGISSVPTILRVIVHLSPHIQQRVPKGSQAWRSPSTLGASPDDVSHLHFEELPLINAYFSHVHPIIPMIDEADFRQRYVQLDTIQEETGPWLALLNMVLAMGCMASDSVHFTGHNPFYKRALPYLNISSFGSGHLYMVQAMALYSGMILHFLNKPNMATAVMGATLQMAVAMGLHRVQIAQPYSADTYHRTNGSPITRVRTWWSILCLDTWASSTLGRPSMRYWDPTTTLTSPMSALENLDYGTISLAASERFCRIATGIQERLIQLPLISSDEINAFDRDLRDWKDSLHAFLTHREQCPPSLNIARTVLHWRWITTRLTLYRPSLLTMALHQKPWGQTSTAEAIHARTCLEIAKEGVQIIELDWSSNQVLCWNSAWNLFQVSLVLILGLMSDKQEAEKVDCNEHISRAIELFARMEPIDPGCVRSRKLLQGLVDNIKDAEPSVSFSDSNTLDLSLLDYLDTDMLGEEVDWLEYFCQES
ncbi:beta-mannosidase [Fusarium longipes]|uniref:Beta-mannosidase B n=1 Tax=Fusarium longipes TaxID=694270 RepID=A0A395T8D4_9HYPO|nr:beta-mannosidase [Fusarium longipes]